MSVTNLQQPKRHSLPPPGTARQDKGESPFRKITAPKISLPPAPTSEEEGKLRGASDRALGRALKPAIEAVILETLRENPRVVIEIVYPVLGRVIRKSIATALQGLVASIENQAANVFSPQRLKWRWQAMTSDRSYAEIVLANSILYSVDEIMLVHRETGLLLVHASRDPDRAQGADLVSSMLTAIEDFARDSFDLDEEEALSQFTLGSQHVLIRTSPLMLIAAAVGGSPSSKVSDQLDETLEQVHRDYIKQLEEFSGDTDPFVPLLPSLENLLTQATGASERKVP